MTNQPWSPLRRRGPSSSPSLLPLQSRPLLSPHPPHQEDEEDTTSLPSTGLSSVQVEVEVHTHPSGLHLPLQKEAPTCTHGLTGLSSLKEAILPAESLILPTFTMESAPSQPLPEDATHSNLSQTAEDHPEASTGVTVMSRLDASLALPAVRMSFHPPACSLRSFGNLFISSSALP